MKKIRLMAGFIFIPFVLYILCACNFNDTSMTSSITTVNSEFTAAETTLLQHVQVDPILYPTLEKFLAVTDIVIVGTVVETLPAVRLKKATMICGKALSGRILISHPL